MSTATLSPRRSRHHPRQRTPSSPSFPFSVRRVGDSVLVEIFEPNVVSREVIDNFSQAIEQATSRGRGQRLVLSLAGVRHVSTVFLGKLVALDKQLRASGGGLTLTQLHGRVREVLRVTRLDTQLTIREAPSKAEPLLRAWVSLVAVLGGSSVLGLYLLMRLCLDGLPRTGRPGRDGVAAAGMLLLGAFPVLLVPGFALRDLLMKNSLGMQWALAAGAAAICVAGYLAFVLAL